MRAGPTDTEIDMHAPRRGGSKWAWFLTEGTCILIIHLMVSGKYDSERTPCWCTPRGYKLLYVALSVSVGRCGLAVRR